MDQLFEVKLLRLAQEDIECIFCWLQERSAGGATRWYSAFQEAAMELSREPTVHRLVNHFMSTSMTLV